MPADCSLDFGSSKYVGEIFRRASRERIPISGSLDITYRCNLRCSHCYVGHLVEQRRAEAHEMSASDIERLLEQAADAGCMFLLISGGEPLLRDDFTRIYIAARRLGMIVSVFTNAALVSEDHLEAFREYPPRHVEVTLYGATEATHDKVTGVPGSYRAVRRGIERLIDAGIRVDAKSMILRDNAHEIGAMAQWAKDSDLRYRVDAIVTPRLDGDCGPNEQRADPGLAVEIEMGLDGMVSSTREFVERQRAATKGESVAPEHMFRCGAGRGGFQIDPGGMMHPCVMSSNIAFDAKIYGFDEAWKEVTQAVDRASWVDGGSCASCGNIYLCGYCAALLLLEGTTPSDPPEYLCRLGEHRARAIGMETSEVTGVSRG